MRFLESIEKRMCCLRPLGRPTMSWHTRCGLAAISALACATMLAVGQTTVRAKVLSSRPEMVSGGSALIGIDGAATHPSLSVWIGSREITGAFRPGQIQDALVGLVGGLASGENHLEVRDGKKVLASLALVNHDASDSLVSGTKQSPFICETVAAGLGEPLDKDCSASTRVFYIYKSTQPPPAPGATAAGLPAGFKLYVPGSTPMPADVAQIPGPAGTPVPYFVRVERGTLNRAVYQIAFLHQPGTPLPTPWKRAGTWNGRLVYSFGGGCGGGYHQGGIEGGLDEAILLRGYAEATASLNVLQTNCNDVISAETAERVKEYFIKTFGAPVHTIGIGASGGSIQQYLIAQNYPGILDGIIPIASFPDVASILPGIVDCSLMARVFDSFSTPLSEEQKTAIAGFAAWKTCTNVPVSWMALQFSPNLVRASACNDVIPRQDVYDPRKNLRGARCDYYDNAVNIFGIDPATGYARRALDNVGVQYGLQAFNSGTISADQFLALNEKIGGYDIDGNPVSQRMVADEGALRAAYSTGRMNSGAGGLGSIPIIDVRPYGDLLPDIHDQFRSFVMRARLQRANGTSQNQVMITYPVVSKPGTDPINTFAGFMTMAVPLMDQWLDTIGRDRSKRSISTKIAAARPRDLTDACYTDAGEKISETRSYDGTGRCNQLYPPHADPRIAAGAPLEDNVLKCALKPVDPKDYKQPLSSKDLARLKAVFPLGVCNYAVHGVEQGLAQQTWRTY